MNERQFLADIAREHRDLSADPSSPNEDVTLDRLIKPVLEQLGYPTEVRLSEQYGGGCYPDLVIYGTPVSGLPDSDAWVVLEAKKLNENFEVPGGRTESPKRQIGRYLCSHPSAGPSSFGVLTDGRFWHVLRRTGFHSDMEVVGDFDIFGSNGLADFNKLKSVVGRETLAGLDRPAVQVSKSRESAIKILEVLDTGTASEVVGLLAPNRTLQTPLPQQKEIKFSSRAKDAMLHDWDSHDWDWGCPIAAPEQLKFAEESRAVIAVLRFTSPETRGETGLGRQAVDLAAKTFAKLSDVGTVVLFAHLELPRSQDVRARIAVHTAGRTSMTAEFTPSSRPENIITTIANLKNLLASDSPQTPDSLTKTVEVKQIRTEFHNAIAKWVKDKQHTLGQGQKGNEAVLRHLIRVVFAWILKENGLCNTEIFDDWFAQKYMDGYYANVLAFLFHERFNTPVERRQESSHSDVQHAMDDVPFLNGSVFAPNADDNLMNASFSDYFSVDAEQPGLFTILSRYEWSIDEHSASVSEQTIDGEILSHLFENLVVTTLQGDPVPNKMPHGTYYTPSDVSGEMAKDALAVAVHHRLPDVLSLEELRELFGDPHFDPTHIADADKQQLRDIIASLSVLDPAVGSGAFLLATGNAIARALSTLREDQDRQRHTFRVIAQNQLHGLDIHPMAVQITRLRMFIAIMSNEKHLADHLSPLPNLEARIVCADTLQTVADRDWRPVHTGSLVDSDTDIQQALENAAKVHQEWLEAHTETQKQNVRHRNEITRRQLVEKLNDASWGEETHPEMWEFAKHEIFDPNPPPSKADARLIFWQQGLNGFDILIGNPPYVGTGNDQKKQLKAKKYVTSRGGNLYNHFCETALTLAKKAGGVVELIVPHSLSFADMQTPTRELFEMHSTKIWIRHQDNRPDETFGESPVQNVANRQRTTIITALTGNSPTTIWTTGMSRWLSAEREAYFRSRNFVQMPDTFTKGRHAGGGTGRLNWHVSGRGCRLNEYAIY